MPDQPYDDDLPEASPDGDRPRGGLDGDLPGDGLDGAAYVLPPAGDAPVDDGGLSGDAEGITGVPHPDEAADDERSELDLNRLRAANVDAGVYDSSSITVLEGLEAVRKRPGMYIGSTSERGLHYLVYEVVDNSVDEALAGFADRIEVTLLADGGVRVKDNGRGMPVDMHPQQKRPTVEVILTVLHAGGKFDGKAYAVSGGLHGVGVSVVNALSSRLEVDIERDGFRWTQPYVDQKPAEPLKKGEPSKKTGTTVTFWADEAIFETTKYDYETIRRRIQEYAFLNKGLTIVLRDERVERIVDEDDSTATPARPKTPKEVE